MMVSEAEIPESSPGRPLRLRLGMARLKQTKAVNSTGSGPVRGRSRVAPNKPNPALGMDRIWTWGLSNKANPGRGDLGIDYGLGMIDDWDQRLPGPAPPNKPNFRLEAGDRRPERVFLRPTASSLRPRCAKQTQFDPATPEREIRSLFLAGSGIRMPQMSKSVLRQSRQTNPIRLVVCPGRRPRRTPYGVTTNRPNKANSQKAED